MTIYAGVGKAITMIGRLAYELLGGGIGFIKNRDPSIFVGAINKYFDTDDFVFFTNEFEDTNFGAVRNGVGFINFFGDTALRNGIFSLFFIEAC